MESGDGLYRVRTDPERITVREMCHLLYFDPENLEGARKALRIPALSPGWRQSFEDRLGEPEPRSGEATVKVRLIVFERTWFSIGLV